MATRVFNAAYPNDHLPLLRWLAFTGVCVFAFVLAWHFSLVRMMVNGDKTYISVIIGALRVLSSLHCLVCTAAISRELDRARRALALVANDARLTAHQADDIVNEGKRVV
jgi:hypothetical protein